jgi:multidrug efflux pump subunit AcrA (membrane-fusion protein)
MDMNKQQKRILFIGIGVVALASAILLAGCASASASPTAASGSSTATPLPPVSSGNQIIADGKVIPLQSASLSFTVGGNVEKVLVAEGDAVQINQPIARLAGSQQAQAGVAAAQLELLNAKQALTNLTRNAPVSAAQAQLDLANARKAEKDAKENSLNASSGGKKEALQKAKDWLADAQSRYDYLVAHNDGSVNAQFQIAMAYQEVIRALQEVQKAQNEYDNALRNGGDGDTSTAEIERAKYALTMAQRKAAEDALGRLRNGVDPEALAITEARVLNAERQLEAAQTALNNLELRAPFAGTVVSLSLKEGEFVTPGIVVVRIADLSGWKIETTNLSEMDVVKVKLGDTVVVTFDALPGVKLTGRVDRINGYGETQQGEITYKVTVLLDPNQTALYWNMTAIVKIH